MHQPGLSHSPTSASFIRPSRRHDPPSTFLEALSSKYVSDTDASAQESTILISGKVVEEVGFDRIRRQLANLPDLRIVILNGLRVGGLLAEPWIEDQELRLQERRRIKDQRFKIVELDLSKNVLERWADVAGICGGLKALRSLKLEYVLLPI